MHRIQRKPSNETLVSVGMDTSTLDSRMSSAEVPQMELLKVNYVHQCKEAFMKKTASSPNYSYMEYKRSIAAPTAQMVQRKNVARIMVTNRHEAPNKPLPPPPPAPVVESWQFLHSPRNMSSNSPPKLVKQSTTLDNRYPDADDHDEDDDDDDVHRESDADCCHYSSCNDTGCDSDTTLGAGDAVKSNSWNYRDRIATCDVRRDIARAGIKSRADRIARIESSECEHNVKAKKDVGPTASSVASGEKEAIAKINKMFEQQKQRQSLPPQPKRPAPVPFKEPNMRLKPGRLNKVDERLSFKPALSVKSECSECLSECQANSSCSEASCPQENGRYRRLESPKHQSNKIQSRIPKPINDMKTPGPLLEQQRTERFQKATTAQNLSDEVKPERSSSSSALDQHMLRHTRASKMERIHIRKKRQPLLIINQLNEPSKEEEEEEPKSAVAATCGYKNCNFPQCPMSKSQHDLRALDEAKDNINKLKRLSLESNSDSGVSSSNDCKDEKKRNPLTALKNLERCSDVKINSTKAQEKKSEHFDDKYAYEKYKMSHNFEGKQIEEDGIIKGGNSPHIKIQVGKSITNFSGHYNAADPNDVTNFSKKNLTKTTPTEALNNSMAKAVKLGPTSAKQCNLENEQRLKIQNNLQCLSSNAANTTNIRIDDDWVKEEAPSHDQDYLNGDSLAMLGERKKPINTQENAVKIFVRSSSHDNHDQTRSSCLSANSFVSQTSVCTNTSASSHSTCSSASSCTSSSSATESSSDCSTSSSNADNHSLCDSERECCCPCSTNEGMFFNNPSNFSTSPSSSVVQTICDDRACTASPLSSTDAISNISCVTCSMTDSTVVASSLISSAKSSLVPLPKASSIVPCCSAADNGGIFWNNSYMSFEAQEDNQREGDLPCCCSLSSCDEDNCSYYEGETNKAVASVRENNKIEITHSYQSQQPHIQLRSKQQPMMPPKLPKRNVRASSGEEILMRQQLLRKTDVIHELRPRSMDGVVDSGVSLTSDNGCGSDIGESQQDCEARRLKRGHVLSELLETERIYVNEMSSILKGYCDQMHSEELIHLVPPSLQGKEDILFGNLHELYTFHNDVFLKDLENCISTTELVALCFVQRRDTFYRLYSFYCQNIPRSDRLRETLVDTHLFLQECQKRLGHKLPLAAYLLKPVQRITKYQLLLKDLLRFSDSGSCTKELQKALDCMLIVLKCVNDSMHQVAITGFPTDLSQQGELLLQDSFQVWSESKKDIRLRIKPQQRHIFLYQKSMLFCKQTSKPGHNKSTYQFKHYLKMSQIGLTESVRGDTKRFEVWLQGRQEVHTLQAPTLDIKNKWVAEIKKVLLNQLEELKGEKIKQYGLNHRGMRQTTSWDTPNILLGSTSRTISCDASSESSNRNSNCSSSDDNCTTASIGSVMPLSSNVSIISGATLHGGGAGVTTDKEHNEACGWSSDYSNSEDEMSMAEDNNSTPGTKYVALADYVAVGHSEVSMREGDTVELLKVGCAGWWYIRIIDTSSEGWAPAAYLESINRKSSRSSSRNQERLNLPKLNE